MLHFNKNNISEFSVTLGYKLFSSHDYICAEQTIILPEGYEFVNHNNENDCICWCEDIDDKMKCILLKHNF